MIVAIGSGGEAFKVSPRNRVLQRFVEQSTLTFQFLQVVAQGEVFTVFRRGQGSSASSSMDRSYVGDGAFGGFFALFPE